jgi:hypothetical protein
MWRFPSGEADEAVVSGLEVVDGARVVVLGTGLEVVVADPLAALLPPHPANTPATARATISRRIRFLLLRCQLRLPAY